MIKYILGKKIGMTTIYDKEKGALNVTLIECGSVKVSLIRNQEKDKYDAIQLEIPKTKNKTHRKEFRTVQKDEELKTGKEIGVEIFSPGDKVKISGVSKAKGFQGVVKRHGFKGSPRSHGRKHDWRAPGSIGSSFPEHVFKGKKMAGRMGGRRASVKNVKVISVDKEKQLIAVKGAVPGVAGRIVEIIG